MEICGGPGISMRAFWKNFTEGLIGDISLRLLRAFLAKKGPIFIRIINKLLFLLNLFHLGAKAVPSFQILF